MLVHDITAALIELRAEAEARMVDACTITRSGGEPTFDPVTGTYTDPQPTTIYTGKCEVQVSDGLNARSTEAGGADVTLSRLTVKLPVEGSEDVRGGDTVTISAAVLDSALVDQEYTVLSGHAKSFATSRRLEVQRLTS